VQKRKKRGRKTGLRGSVLAARGGERPAGQQARKKIRGPRARRKRRRRRKRWERAAGLGPLEMQQ